MNDSKKHIRVKELLFLVVLLFFFIIIFQGQFNKIKIRKLEGYFIKVEKPVLSTESWFDGDFQDNENDYTNQNIGFRSFFVMLYNQLQFTLFDKVNANSVIMGKEGYLYEENYIKAYFGRDFIGEEKIKEKIRKLKEIKDTLSSKGIDLIVTIAPGKGYFHTKFIPDRYSTKEKSITNYEVYKKELLANDIHIIDFNEYFLNRKDIATYLLYPKTGIHWSKYAEVLAADSIIRYIEKLRNIKMPQIVIDSLELSYKLRGRDNDIEGALNLICDLPNFQMVYPRFHLKRDSSTVCPKVLTVADSFYWGVFNWGLSRDVFNKGEFWYYNQQIYSPIGAKTLKVKDVDIIQRVEENDVVQILLTEANFFKFAFGFIDDLHKEYFEKRTIIETKDLDNDSKSAKEINQEEEIQKIINAIKADPNWIELIKKKAEENDISFEEAMRKDAEWLVNQDKKQ